MSLLRMVCEELEKTWKEEVVFDKLEKDSRDLLDVFRFLDDHAEEIDQIIEDEHRFYNFVDINHILKRGIKYKDPFDLATALLKIMKMTDKTYGEMVESRIKDRICPRFRTSPSSGDLKKRQ